MTTTTTSCPSTAVAAREPVFTGAERLAVAGFLAGYTGLTREAYALDLRQFTVCCQQRHLQLFQARRPTSNALPVIWKQGAGHGRR
jgi:integrase/recombinase XerD